MTVPISSQIFCKLTSDPINPLAVFEYASDFGHGAQNFFFGAVRSINRGQDVQSVAYDAAVPLAEAVFFEIAGEASKKWGSTLKICILHRIGKLLVGEISVGIGVSSPHRDEAYLASRYIIEQIKVRAPIWKKEYYINGESDWLKGHALCQHNENSKDC